MDSGPSWSRSYDSWIYNYLCNQCLSPLMLWVRISIIARYITLCDKGCQWLATCRWFSPRPWVSFINKTDRHDITEILLKVALDTTSYVGNIEKACRTHIKCVFYMWNSFVFLYLKNVMSSMVVDVRYSRIESQAIPPFCHVWSWCIFR